MSRNYDNWERLVGAVLRREQDREVALADSRSTSFSSISISLDFDEQSLSLPREQNVENGRRNSSDGSYVASSSTKGIAGCKVDLEGAQGILLNISQGLNKKKKKHFSHIFVTWFLLLVIIF
ncbi:uncharacterized protein LOC111396526 isoform X1 [Olea europaea var. sylvestris]|uniref:uncharacterized protein LOC111396526 isoform X1 n=1 Tax=Olea europaea var. sylvestris TaxID=158386 RepID=UPI000C1D0491|nr:uncharacterized protein LOC111396526 isoform X1 [Olea europaea var. sylvestris]